MKQFLVALGDDCLIHDMEELDAAPPDTCYECAQLREDLKAALREQRDEVADLKRKVAELEKLPLGPIQYIYPIVYPRHTREI